MFSLRNAYLLSKCWSCLLMGTGLQILFYPSLSYVKFSTFSSTNLYSNSFRYQLDISSPPATTIFFLFIKRILKNFMVIKLTFRFEQYTVVGSNKMFIRGKLLFDVDFDLCSQPKNASK